jgi:hypothetical protein
MLSKYFKFFKETIIDIHLNQEKDINIQIFYTQDKNKAFNEKESIHVISKKNKKVKQISIKLPNVYDLRKLRIDFGQNPGKILLTKVKITGNKNITFNKNELYNFPTNQIDLKKISNNGVELISSRIDPFIILNSIQFNKNIDEFDIFQMISVFILIFFFIYMFIIIY